MSVATHATPFEAPEVAEVSRLFPSYEILSLIACGGMGAVYHAIQTSLERPVAIKILPREFSKDAEFRASFESEAKAMAKLNHPNLIGVYDFGEAEGLLFIVMEFVAGQSLHHAAHGCAVEHADAINLVIGVCHGLAHAHDFGILHRDIKPSNILLDGQMNPKIGDFGLARPLEREVQEGEQIFGTPGYTAPEVLHPPFLIDQRTDIFSVGVMLHEILTGSLPDADPRPASKICGCNPRLDTVIKCATDPDPNRRYSSATEVAKELLKIAMMATRSLRLGAPVQRGNALSVSKALPPVVPPKPSPKEVSKPAHSALSQPVRADRAALSRPVPALSRPAPTLTKPAATSPLPKNRLNQPKTLSKESSDSGLIIFLVAALIIAVIAFFVIKDRQSGSPLPPSPPPTSAGEEKPIPPPSSKPVTEKVKELDPTEALRRTRSSIRTRVAPSLESHRLDMKNNLSNYKTAIESAAESLSVKDRKRISKILSENLGIWETSGHELPESLPSGLGAIEGAEDIHADHLGKQVAIQRDLEREMASLAGVYVLELQNQIEQIAKDGNARAVDALEDEVRAVEGNVERFREKISE